MSFHTEFLDSLGKRRERLVKVKRGKYGRQKINFLSLKKRAKKDFGEQITVENVKFMPKQQQLLLGTTILKPFKVKPDHKKI